MVVLAVSFVVVFGRRFASDELVYMATRRKAIHSNAVLPISMSE
jgi:hypothetical protein